MDRTAIEKIAELALDANAASRLDTHTPAFLYGDKAVSLEHLDEGRARFRGRFGTTSLADFVAYVKANSGGENHRVGFIDPKNPKATVFFNLGTVDTPGHGDWTATLALEPTAGFAALQAIEGKPSTQKDLAEWIEDWLPNLEARATAEEGGTKISMAAAVTAIRNLTISAKSDVTHSDRDFGAARTAIEEIEARSKEGHGIPTHLVFRTEPYAGFQQREFLLRISVITGDKPALKLRIVSKETVFEDIAREFKALLITEVGDAAALTIGSFQP